MTSRCAERRIRRVGEMEESKDLQEASYMKNRKKCLKAEMALEHEEEEECGPFLTVVVERRIC